jgi:hypothetical protein
MNTALQKKNVSDETENPPHNRQYLFTQSVLSRHIFSWGGKTSLGQRMIVLWTYISQNVSSGSPIFVRLKT